MKNIYLISFICLTVALVSGSNNPNPAESKTGAKPTLYYFFDDYTSSPNPDPESPTEEDVSPDLSEDEFSQSSSSGYGDSFMNKQMSPDTTARFMDQVDAIATAPLIEQDESSTQTFFHDLDEVQKIAQQLNTESDAQLAADFKERLKMKKNTIRQAHKDSERAAMEKRQVTKIDKSSDETEIMLALYNLYGVARTTLHAERFASGKLLNMQFEGDDISKETFNKRRLEQKEKLAADLILIDKYYKTATEKITEKFEKERQNYTLKTYESPSKRAHLE